MLRLNFPRPRTWSINHIFTVNVTAYALALFVCVLCMCLVCGCKKRGISCVCVGAESGGIFLELFASSVAPCLLLMKRASALPVSAKRTLLLDVLYLPPALLMFLFFKHVYFFLYQESIKF